MYNDFLEKCLNCRNIESLEIINHFLPNILGLPKYSMHRFLLVGLCVNSERVEKQCLMGSDEMNRILSRTSTWDGRRKGLKIGLSSAPGFPFPHILFRMGKKVSRAQVGVTISLFTFSSPSPTLQFRHRISPL